MEGPKRARVARLAGLWMLLLPAGVAGQERAAQPLTLEQAIEAARQNNPAFRIRENDRGVANWTYAEALGSVLPRVDAGASAGYRASGTPRVGGLTGEELGISRTPATYSSSYELGLSLQLSGATFFRIAEAKAARTASEADVVAAEFTLAADVTTDYLAALRAADGIRLAQQELESARESQKLAAARYEVGEGTRIDVTQADVAVGRAEVELIRAENAFETAKLRLLQRIGLPLDRDIELTTVPTVFEPKWSREELIQLAMANHPQLESARANESASVAAARAARMNYLPTLYLNGGWRGYTQKRGLSRSEIITQTQASIANQYSNCQVNNKLAALVDEPLADCSIYTYTPEVERRALQANRLFPFDFTEEPPSFSATLSIPIFNGFSRERQRETAQAAADDARHRRREAELAQEAAVATAYLNLMAAYRAVGIEQRNAEAAAEQLELARERYRLGAGTFVDLTQAETVKARADRDYLTALYLFHENHAALEAAVGQRLRP